jgi:hypothetical protein
VGDAAAIQRFLQQKGTRGPRESAVSQVHRPAVSHVIGSGSGEMAVNGSSKRTAADVCLEEGKRRKMN